MLVLNTGLLILYLKVPDKLCVQILSNNCSQVHIHIFTFFHSCSRAYNLELELPSSWLCLRSVIIPTDTYPASLVSVRFFRRNILNIQGLVYARKSLVYVKFDLSSQFIRFCGTDGWVHEMCKRSLRLSLHLYACRKKCFGLDSRIKFTQKTVTMTMTIPIIFHAWYSRKMINQFPGPGIKPGTYDRLP